MRINIRKSPTTIISLAVLIFAMCFAGSIFGQETRGTIRGTVTDPNGQAVPNATVHVTDPARGTTVDLTTNSEGFYQATYLLPSTYQVIVESPGFKKSIRGNVLVQISGTVQVDVPLEVGGTQETVTVTSEVPQLNTEDASLGQVIDQRRIAELPLVHGDPYTLIGLSPGVTSTGDPRLDRPFEPTHIVGFAVNGVRGNRMDLTIDGVASTATANANEVIASYVPPSDIVQEFKVQTATFDAQFGNTEGSVTSISIKSGTNKFHGSAYLFTEPGGMAANDFFGNSKGVGRPDTYSNRPGGYISGPVHIPWLYNGKDKTFFLFGFEAIRDSRPRFDAGNGPWVPTAALASGDFSEFLCPATQTQAQCASAGLTNVYDPLSRTLVSGTTYTGTQFRDPTRATASNPLGLNIIPLNRINPVAKAVLSYLGNPKSPGLSCNICDSTLTEVTKPYNNWTFRVDHQITSNNHMFVRGSWYDRESFYDRYTDSPYIGTHFTFASRGGVIDDVHTFNSTTFLNVKYGYNRFIRASGAQPDGVGFDLTQLWGPSAGAVYNGLVGEGIRRFPRFNFPTGGTIGNGLTNESRPVDSHNAVAVLNKTWGKHSVKFGGELRIYREDDNFASNDQTGQFTFNNTYTRASTSTGSSTSLNNPLELNGLQAFASFLLGLPSTANITRRADYSEYSKIWGFFVQDDWKATRNLTLNLGLRYEKEEALAERQNKSVSGIDPLFIQPSQAQVRANLAAHPVTGVDGNPIDPNTFNLIGGLEFANKDTPGSALYQTPSNTFLPRFGAAYRWGDHTVIRGGLGLYAGFLGERRGDVIQPGYTTTTDIALTTLANGAVIPQSISLFPTLLNGNIQEPTGNTQGKLTGLGGSISFFNQHPKVEKQFRWQIGVQRELPWGFVGEAVYVGNFGYDLEIVKDLNALPNQYLLDTNDTSALATRNTLLTTTQGVTNPFFHVPGFEGSSTFYSNSTISRQQLLKPFPQFTSVLSTNNDGKSWYHAGQFDVQKRFSHGNTVTVAYTWSKWLQATEYLNPGDPKPTKMISDQDAPHRLSISGIYALPFGKDGMWLKGSGLVDRIVGGWQIQGIYQFQTGFPLAFGSFNITGGSTTGDIIYLGGDVNVPSGQQTLANWFNTAAFSSADPGAGHLRTLAYRFSNVRRDNINNVDLSLIKNTRINERMRIQLRLEAINAFNHPYFQAPGTTRGSTTFGVVYRVNPTNGKIDQVASNQANYARRIQLGIKFIF